MNALQRDFWWGKDAGHKGYYPKAWPSLCKPMLKGGLGFREARKFNLAMLAKLAWRLVKEPMALWAKTMGSKYFRNESPFRTKHSKDLELHWTRNRAG